MPWAMLMAATALCYCLGAGSHAWACAALSHAAAAVSIAAVGADWIWLDDKWIEQDMDDLDKTQRSSVGAADALTIGLLPALFGGTLLNSRPVVMLYDNFFSAMEASHLIDAGMTHCAHLYPVSQC